MRKLVLIAESIVVLLTNDCALLCELKIHSMIADPGYLV
jgi:hypothetical protein